MRAAFFLTALTVGYSVSAAQTFNIAVGQNSSLTFSPEFVNASAGDVVQFNFVALNHSATQSTFNAPCSPAGFDSGFMPAQQGQEAPSFQVQVNDSTTPIWVYCKQKTPASHCQAGMVFAINPPAQGDHTFDAFKALAQSGSSGSTNSSAGGSTSSVTNPSSGSPTNGAASTATSPAGSSLSSASTSSSLAPSSSQSGGAMGLVTLSSGGVLILAGMISSLIR